MSYDRSNNLTRGGACLACRRRKTRCDGGRPVCDNCIQKNRAEDCEYSDGHTLTPTQMYEQNIQQLELRKRDLEAAAASTGSNHAFQLHQPYVEGTQLEGGPAQEPSLEVSIRLVDVFLPGAAELGFFLHPQRFKSSVAYPGPAGHHSRPAPALLFAVYLWGIRLSANADFLMHERSFHCRAVEEAAANLCGTHPHRIVHGIQADILLAYYYIAQEKLSEAGHYVTSAITTALSASLHTIRSRRPNSEAEEDILPPAQDPVEEGERILAIWNVFVLDKMMAIVTRQAPNFVTVSDRPDRRVDVPWPMSLADYEQGLLAPQLRMERTIDKFLNNEPTSDGTHNSGMTMLAKAAFLWERVCDLTQQCASASSQGQHTSLAFERRKAELLIDGLEAHTPSISQFMSVGSVEDAGKRILWASILRAAVIELHKPTLTTSVGDDATRGKVVRAAVGIFDTAIGTMGRGIGILNPFVAYTWVDAARAIAAQITHLRATRQVWEQVSEAEAALVGRLGQGVGAMQALDNLFPVMSAKVAEVQRICEGLGL